MKKQRILGLDIIRDIAFFALVSVHFFLNTQLYGMQVNSGKVYLAVILRMLSMVCIPLFLMLTGYLKLNKSLDKKYYAGLVRIVLIYVFAMFFNYTFYHFWDNRILTHASLAKDILLFLDSAWYIGMYIGLYLISPFLNKLFLNLSKQEERILLFSMLFVVSLPTVANAFGVKILPDWWVGIYPIMYYFLGCHFSKNELKISNRKRLLIFVGSVLLMVGFTLFMTHGKVFDFSKWNDWGSPFTVLLSCAVFMLCLGVFRDRKVPKLVQKIIVFISTFSFVGYLVSPVLERIVYKKVVPVGVSFQERFNYYIVAVLSVALLSLLISVFITKIYELLYKKHSFLPYVAIIICYIAIPPIVAKIDEARHGDDFVKYSSSQILGSELTGSLFDPSCIIDGSGGGRFKCYISKRNEGSIVLYTSSDGIHFDDNYQTIIKTDNKEKYIYDRTSILKKDGIYYLYYTKQIDGEISEIYVGTGTDGVNFEFRESPVLTAELDFEAKSVMNPNVIYNSKTNEFMMYYAAGEIYEPDVIGLAISKDGFVWTKEKEPVLTKNSDMHSVDYFKVGATDVHLINGTFYMFYIGYTDIDTARIILTKSQDGKTFDRSYYKMIAEPEQNSFDSDAVYKPSAVYDKETDKWYLYYNGRTKNSEFIGLYTKNGQEL